MRLNSVIDVAVPCTTDVDWREISIEERLVSGINLNG